MKPGDNKAQLRARWSSHPQLRLDAELTSPFGLLEGKQDFRGYLFQPGTTILGNQFQEVNFAHASFRGTWLERCKFENVVFESADFSEVRDHANQFINCIFGTVSFDKASIGLHGSLFRGCTFRRSSFRGTAFVCPRFHGCQFENCKLTGTDFDAASFEDTEFVGELKGTWFRSGYMVPGDEERFGPAAANRMLGVSFADARLWDVNFSGGCDLSTVVMPTHGNYRRYSEWKQRLQRLSAVSKHWPEHERKQSDLFVGSYLASAATQDWFILNLDEIAEEFSPPVANRLIQALDGES